MGFLSSTFNLTKFKVSGNTNLSIGELRSRLDQNTFVPIDNTADESSVGWVPFQGGETLDFKYAPIVNIGELIVFTVRRDERRIPGAVFRREFLKASKTRIQELGVERLPKSVKEELRDLVRLDLLTKVFPVTATADVIWNTTTNALYFSTSSSKLLDSLQDLFRMSFDEFSLELEHPYSKCSALLSVPDQKEFTKLNRTTSDAFLDNVEANQWLGTEFASWLLYQTLESDSVYKTLDNEEVVTFVGEKITLVAESDEGLQRVTLSGPQKEFKEALMSLAQGKLPTMIQQNFEFHEDRYSMSLDLATFQFAGVKSPKLVLDSDSEDEVSELEASVLLRAHSITVIESLFEASLTAYLDRRLSPVWNTFMTKYNELLDSNT